jgi:hypothetical protein
VIASTARVVDSFSEHYMRQGVVIGSQSGRLLVAFNDGTALFNPGSLIIEGCIEEA